MTNEDRIETLERQLSAVKRYCLCLSAVLLLAAAVYGLFSTKFSSTARGAAANEKRVIHTNELILVDENGRPQVIMQTTKDGPKIRMIDTKGRLRLGLKVTKDGPAVAMFDEAGKVRRSKIRADRLSQQAD